MGENLLKDPYNIIIAGVGGQGNVTASRVLGNMLIRNYFVTIGETFGASQRGGSVMSHVRVSAQSVWSPQIPERKADLIAALEPTEALRVTTVYGHKDSHIVVNARPVYPAGVAAGELRYPPLEEIKKALLSITEHVWFVKATDTALQLGNPILGNMVILGVVASLDVLPIGEEDFEWGISRIFSEDKVALNVKALEMGINLRKE